MALTTQYIGSTTDKPPELNDLPEGLVADYVYFLAELSDMNTPIVLASYSRLERSMLYVDTNGDGHLSDEKSYPVKVKKLPRREGSEYEYGPILMKSHGGKGGFETNFLASTYHGQNLFLQPSGYRVGKVRLDDNTYKVAFIDGNFDGRYDKIFSIPTEVTYHTGCDLFAIDLNGDRKSWQLSLDQISEIMPLSRMVKVRNTYYAIDVAPDGTALELKKVEPELGRLDFAGTNVKLKLWSEAADQYLFSSEGCWQIPAGSYSALFVELNEMDSEENIWTFSSRLNTGSLRNFEIRPGQTTSFKIGPPFIIKTDIKQIGNRISIGLKLEGCAGEQYRFPVTKGGRQQPAPTFKILDESGEELVSGQFKYG